MKCPRCSSEMYVADETVNPRSQVTFYRCSLCVCEQVSSQPANESATPRPELFGGVSLALRNRPLTA